MKVATTFYKKMFSSIALSLLLFTSNGFSQSIEIYVSDAGNFSSPPWKILKFNENGENPEVFINNQLAWPQDILFLEDQQVVLISNLNTGRITKYSSSTGAYLDNFATGIAGPTRMKIGADSLLYVLQWSGNGKVRRYQLNGTFVDEFTSVGVPQSIGLEWDSNGNLYVSSYSGDNVRKFGPNGNDLELFVTSNLAGPTNIWIDENDNLFVLDYDGTAVKKFNSNGVFQNNFATGLNQSEGVDFFSNGNILIGNGATSSVKMFNSNGVYIKDLIPNGSGGLMIPNAVVIRKIDPVSVQEESSINIPQFDLNQNCPNPLNPTIKIKFSVPSFSPNGTEGSLVTLKVYNVLGTEFSTLVNQEPPAGEHEVTFDASNFTSGIYFYKLQTDNFIETKKMILLK